jgi:predicted nucleotidyltransferase component of viral defense system
VIALTRDVESHRKIVPWVDDLHVEQDLLLSLAMVVLFEDKLLKEHIAMRGGTALHKIHLALPARYSADIDLVVIDRNEKRAATGLKRPLQVALFNCDSVKTFNVRDWRKADAPP